MSGLIVPGELPDDENYREKFHHQFYFFLEVVSL